MTVTIKLTREEHQRIKVKAAQLGLDPADYVRQLIQRDTDADGTTLGKRLLEQWESDGVLGLFADRADTPEFARELRLKAEQRG